MSKSPDLSAFPIPRKGGARPISMDEVLEDGSPLSERGGEGAPPKPATAAAKQARAAGSSPNDPALKRRSLPAIVQQPPTAVVSGQVVATTVKLDEGRYLRLVNAGQPGPGRLKRRTIQEMMVEAVDEWFERRGL